MWRPEGSLVEADFLFLSCDSWGLNSGCEAWWQAPLAVEPFYCILKQPHLLVDTRRFLSLCCVSVTTKNDTLRAPVWVPLLM